MAITFNPDVGVVVDDGQTVRENVASDWKQAFQSENTPELNTEPETPAGQLIDGITALILQKDNDILFLSNMFNPATAVGIFQDALAKIYFIDRHIAQPTTVTCTCNGLSGTQIPTGSIVQDVDGNQYTNSEPVTIGESGSVDVLFSCTQTGPITVNANSVNKIVSVIPGWDSVNNDSAGVTGRDMETQAEFEQRRYDSVAKNSHGLAESVEGSLNNLSDVIACRVEQNRTNKTVTTLGVQIPAHSIYLSVYGGTSQEIGSVIYNKLDAGCGTAGNNSVTVIDPINGSQHLYYYTQATTQDTYIQVTVNPNAIYNSDNVKQAILDNFNGVTNNFARIKMGETLYASRFYEDIISTGLNDLVMVQVSTDGDNFYSSVNFDLNQMPTLSLDNISIVEEE